MKLTLSLALFFPLFLSTAAFAADKIPLLIVDGQNNHNWAVMTPPMKKWLEETGRFTVDVATTPKGGEKDPGWEGFHPDFSKYKVVLSNYNGTMWPAEVKTSFEKFVAGGGGFVVIHAANNSFPGWKEYDKMIGLGWRDAKYGLGLYFDEEGKLKRRPVGQGPGASHGAQHSFVIQVRDAENPVMKGMPEKWLHARDELYHGQRGPAEEMTILATAFSDKKAGGTGEHEPMIWWIPYGKGKVFTTVMGHVGGKDDPSIKDVGFVTVMRRACEWVATGEVTISIPDDFPTEKEVKLMKE